MVDMRHESDMSTSYLFVRTSTYCTTKWDTDADTTRQDTNVHTCTLATRDSNLQHMQSLDQMLRAGLFFRWGRTKANQPKKQRAPRRTKTGTTQITTKRKQITTTIKKKKNITTSQRKKVTNSSGRKRTESRIFRLTDSPKDKRTKDNDKCKYWSAVFLPPPCFTSNVFSSCEEIAEN